MSESLDMAQWARHWEAMARQAQATLGGNIGQPPWGTCAANAGWTEALGKANPFADGKQQSEAMERMLSGAQGYLGMLQSLAAAATGQTGSGGESPADAFGNGTFPGAFSSTTMANPMAAAMRGLAGSGARGFDQMMEQFAAAAGPMFDKARGALHQPAFGFLREKQENLQKTAQVLIDYQEQSARYDRLMLKVGEQSFARFQLKLAEREEPGRQIESARALYDLWIDAAEEAYAEIALSEEFREVYAAVVDAQMRVRRQVQGEIERYCNELGMPTRSEVDSIGQRLQALRREFRNLHGNDAGYQALLAEIEVLRNEVAALKAKPRAGAGSAATDAPEHASRAGARKTSKRRKAAATSPRSKTAGSKSESAKMTSGKTGDGKPSGAAVAAAAAQAGARSFARPVKVKLSKAKGRRKPAAKAGAKRRAKRSRSDAGKSVAAAGAAMKSTQQVRKDKPKGNSFAASIARFARKSKTAAAGRVLQSRKTGSGKRGGDR
jgi:hypothetical protein